MITSTENECFKKFKEDIWTNIFEVLLRVVTAQEKQGIWMSNSPDSENTGNLPTNIKNLFFHRKLTSNTVQVLKIPCGKF